MPANAVTAILNWTAQTGEGGKKVNLSGLQKLSDVKLSGKIVAFNPLSNQEVTRDFFAALGRYVANFVMRKKKKKKSKK